MDERVPSLYRSAVATAVVAVTLLGAFALQGALAVRHHAPTYDEATHLTSGYAALLTGDFRLNPQVPPLVKMLLAAPLYVGDSPRFAPDPELWKAAKDYPIGQAFLYGLAEPDRILATARFVNLALGALLVGLIGWWALRLWGRAAALVAMALAAVEPNLVAHSALVTTDVGATLFVVLTLYLFWEAAAARSVGLWLATGASTGLAVATKYSALTLLLVMAAILTAHAVLGGVVRAGVWWPGSTASAPRRVGQCLVVVALLCGPAMLVIAAAYFFQGVSPWWSGLQRFLQQAAAGQPAFFLGQLSHAGWWAYFPVAFLIKTPIGTLVLVAASLLLVRLGARFGRSGALFLLLPVLAVFAVSASVKTNIGIRHVLVVYPLLCLVAARVATITWPRAWLRPVLVATALAATGVSSLSVTPHQLAYFNELVGGPAHGHRYLSDSNIDWGQDLKAVKTFMDREGLPIVYLSYFGSAPPDHYGIRYQYVPGAWPLQWPPRRDVVPDTQERKVLIISVSNLQEVHSHDEFPGLFAWLRARQPVARIGYSMLVYDLSGDIEALDALAETYRRTGLGDHTR